MAGIGGGGVDRVLAFDMGETLTHYEGIPLNWSEHYREGLSAAFAAAGIHLPEEAIPPCCDVLRRYNTRINPREREVSSDDIFAAVLDECGLGWAKAAKLTDGYFSYFRQRCRPYPETEHALRALSDKGYYMAILTDVPYGMPRRFVEEDLVQAGIRKYFGLLLTSVETGYRKPSGRTFTYLADRLGIAASDLAYVGNEKKDIEGANSVGGYSILIDRTGKGESYGERRRIGSLNELVDGI